MKIFNLIVYTESREFYDGSISLKRKICNQKINIKKQKNEQENRSPGKFENKRESIAVIRSKE